MHQIRRRRGAHRVVGGALEQVEQLNAELNPDGKVPWFEAIAMSGKGVFETFRGVSHLLMEKVAQRKSKLVETMMICGVP